MNFFIVLPFKTIILQYKNQFKRLSYILCFHTTCTVLPSQLSEDFIKFPSLVGIVCVCVCVCVCARACTCVCDVCSCTHTSQCYYIFIFNILILHLLLRVILFTTSRQPVGNRYITKTSQLILYREIMAVCSEIHTKHINTVCGQNAELLNVKLVVHIVTTGL